MIPRAGKLDHEQLPGLQESGAWRLTYFSLSPNHLDIKSEEDTEKKVELLASVATALAR